MAMLRLAFFPLSEFPKLFNSTLALISLSTNGGEKRSMIEVFLPGSDDFSFSRQFGLVMIGIVGSASTEEFIPRPVGFSIATKFRIEVLPLSSEGDGTEGRLRGKTAEFRKTRALNATNVAVIVRNLTPARYSIGGRVTSFLKPSMIN